MSQTQPGTRAKPKRKLVSTATIIYIIIIGVLGYGAYWFFLGQYLEVTEDAYVEGNIVQVTSQTTGTVIAIAADNTDSVIAGSILISLNPVDARVSLERAEAQLAKTVRQVRGQFSTASQMNAIVELRRSDLSRAQEDMKRRAPLAQIGAVSGEDLHHAEDTVKAAQAALAAAKQELAGNQALVDRVSIQDHHDVRMAAVQVRDAYIALARTGLRAPVTGMVTKRNVHVGQRVSPGAPLVSVVPLEQVWVSANFKESQLRNLRIGQPVKLIADAYGSGVAYTGRVVGMDAGTGSAFSLLPAQNATGNWIKIVQRVPVRIALDLSQVQRNPLRIGLSMKVEVDTMDRQGEALAISSKEQHQSYNTSAFDNEVGIADEVVRKIILANLGHNTRTGKNPL